MSNAILILGNSGTGKSTSIRTLPPEQTFIVNVLGKPLPFRGSSKNYTKLSADGTEGNFYTSDDSQKIMRSINLVNTKRPEIKYMVIDDFGYTVSNSFMRRSKETGFGKFVDLGKDAWEILKAVNEVREDLLCFITMHSDIDQNGRSKPKTIGKLLDEKVCVEGMFTCVLHSDVSDGKYYFITNDDGSHKMAKSPMDLFKSVHIPNDLKMIADTLEAYYNEDIII